MAQFLQSGEALPYIAIFLIALGSIIIAFSVARETVESNNRVARAAERIARALEKDNDEQSL